MSYTMIDNGRAIRCGECGTASYNRNDIAQKYCGRCHKYHTHYSTLRTETLTRQQLIDRGYTTEPYQPPIIVADTTIESANDCRAGDDARPSSSDPIDYGTSSDSGCSSGSDSSGGWGSE